MATSCKNIWNSSMHLYLFAIFRPSQSLFYFSYYFFLIPFFFNFVFIFHLFASTCTTYTCIMYTQTFDSAHNGTHINRNAYNTVFLLFFWVVFASLNMHHHLTSHHIIYACLCTSVLVYDTLIHISNKQ